VRRTTTYARSRPAPNDYIVKPFSQRELIARVRAHLRRATLGRDTTRDPGVLEIGPVRMNVDERTVAVDGKDLRLTSTEFRLLRYLL
jgi:DNA-binding response OmpR family regulator